MKIKYKLWGGFAGLLFVLAAIVVSGLNSLSITEKKLQKIIEVDQPMVNMALRMQYILSHSAETLVMYSLGKEDIYRQHYVTSLDELAREWELFEKQPYLNTHPQLKIALQKLEAKIKTFVSYQEKIDNYAQNVMQRVPAMNFTATTLNPIYIEMSGNLSAMMDMEIEQDGFDPKRKEIFNILQQARYFLSMVSGGIRGFFAFTSELNKTNTQAYMQQLEKLVEQLGNYEEDLFFEQLDGFEILKEQIVLYRQYMEKLFVLHGSEKGYMDVYFIRTEVAPLVESINTGIDQLVTLVKKQANEESIALSQRVSETQTLFWGLLIISLVVGVIVSVSVSYSILSALDKPITLMQDIAQGEGDLTRRLNIQGNDEITVLAKNFNHFVDKIQHIVIQVGSALGQLNQSTQKVQQSITITSQDLLQQSENNRAVKDEMDQVLHASEHVLHNAKATEDAANDASQEAQQGELIVSQSIDNVENSAQEIAQAREVVLQLEKQSEEIGSVLSVIQGIAEQTNLLALNAAIEAARAGEQGRGFAVVADEVRTLASKTQGSAEEIRVMINKLQVGSQEAAEVMNAGNDKIHATVVTSEEVKTSFNRIVESIDTIHQHSRDILSSAKQQTGVVEGIHQRIISIHEIADKIAEDGKSVSKESEELHNISEQLNTLIHEFKV